MKVLILPRPYRSFAPVRSTTTYYVGSIEDSEWIQYTIDAAAAALYNLKLNVAAETTGQVSIIIDSKTVVDKKDIAATGSLKNWQTQNIGSSRLSKGHHVIRIYFNKGGFNLKNSQWACPWALRS